MLRCKAFLLFARIFLPIVPAVQAIAAMTATPQRTRPVIGKARGRRRARDPILLHTLLLASQRLEAHSCHIQEAILEDLRLSSSAHRCRILAEEPKYPYAAREM